MWMARGSREGYHISALGYQQMLALFCSQLARMADHSLHAVFGRLPLRLNDRDKFYDNSMSAESISVLVSYILSIQRKQKWFIAGSSYSSKNMITPQCPKDMGQCPDIYNHLKFRDNPFSLRKIMRS
jgi:hypothetical protein